MIKSEMETFACFPIGCLQANRFRQSFEARGMQSGWEFYLQIQGQPERQLSTQYVDHLRLSRRINNNKLGKCGRPAFPEFSPAYFEAAGGYQHAWHVDHSPREFAQP